MTMLCGEALPLPYCPDGGGLSLPFDQFDVSLAPEEPPLLLETRGAAYDGRLWTLAHLDPAPGYAGAVAALGHDWSMLLRRWDGTAAGTRAIAAQRSQR